MENEFFVLVNFLFGGIDDVIFLVDGKIIFYVCKKKSGKDFVVFINIDIYVFKIDIGSLVFVIGVRGYDMYLVIFFDGKKMVWLSMVIDGFELDKNCFFICDLGLGIEKDLIVINDVFVEYFFFLFDGKMVYYIVVYYGIK